MRAVRFGIVVFPGSNCDMDCYHVAKNVVGQDAEYVWHEETDLSGIDCVILPGGFSYGDYLRAGAIARFSPVMRAVAEEAKRGKLVIGICNGFQILLEAGLLPGAMAKNRGLRFICRFVNLRVENVNTPFTRFFDEGEVVRIPIAHYEGCYFAPPEMLDEIERNRQVVFRYCDEKGNVTDEANPNGSLNNIAGIVNREGNVLGMMPHPERAAEEILGSTDGRRIFEAIVASVAEAGRKAVS